MDFSGSNVNDCFNSAEERSSKDDGWIVLAFNLSECLICHLELNVCWFEGHGSKQELIGDWVVLFGDLSRRS